MLSLTVAKGPDRGAVFEWRSPARIVIGRNSPDLTLNDIMISRYHARIKHEDGQWTVRDLGSRNGTIVNGHRIHGKTVLKTGDRIATGYTEFEVKLTEAPVPAAAAPAAPAASVAAAPAATPEVDAVADLAAALEQAAGASTSEGIELEPAKEPQVKAAPQAPVAVAAPIEPAAHPPRMPDADDSSHDLRPIAAAPAPKVNGHHNGNGNGHRNGNGHAHIAAEATEPKRVEASAERVAAPVSQPAPVAKAETKHASFADVMSEVAETAGEPAEPSLPLSAEESSPIADIESHLAALEANATALYGAAEAAEAPTAAKASAAPVADASEGERPASEWMSAIESQLVVAESQGWDDSEEEDDEAFVAAALATDEVQPLDELQRSLLYMDEDDHWADDVQIDDEELIASLQEDGPEALLAAQEAAPAQPVRATVTVSREDKPAKKEPVAAQRNGKSKRRRKR